MIRGTRGPTRGSRSSSGRGFRSSGGGGSSKKGCPLSALLYIGGLGAAIYGLLALLNHLHLPI